MEDTPADYALALSNLRAGRTVPAWRITVVMYLGALLLILGGFVDNIWIRIGILIVWSLVVGGLLGRYQKRSIQ